MKRKVSIFVSALLLALVSTMPALAQDGKTYRIKAGDTLGDISVAMDVSVQALMDANGITAPDLIFEGQTLSIPGGIKSPTMGVYTVQAGDTLYDVAVKFNTSVQFLADSNNLSNVDTIFSGQILKVPGAASVTPSVVATNACARRYTIQWGDTLSSIAWQNGVTTQSLASANNLFGETIFAGQQLCIPQSSAAPASASTRKYTVKAGDTVTNIAYRYGVSQWSIVQANNLSDAGFIFVGQILDIPGGASATNATASQTQNTTVAVTPSPPSYVAPNAPAFQDISQTWDGSVTMVNAVNTWVGAQTADFPDPDDLTTIMVRTVGALDVPVILKQGDTEIHLTTSNSSEFGWATMGMKDIPAGDWQVWVEQDKSEIVSAYVKEGQRILVEFTFENVTPDLPPRSPSGWSGQVTKNTSGSEPANGVWSTIIVRTGVKGLPVTIRSEANDFSAMCTTGTKPEYGKGACDFGGLWPGKYIVGIDSTGIEVKLFVDGQGYADVQFERQ